jgi:uncharacterized protein (TIRG00374 family)
MRRFSPTGSDRGNDEHDATVPMTPEESGFGAAVQGAAAGAEEEPAFFEDPKRILTTFAIAVGAVAAVYLLLPTVLGVDDGLSRVSQGDTVWIIVALAFGLSMFVAYVALFKGVIGESVRLRWNESYEITMAGLAATRIFSAGGAGGIVLTYWALRKAGMPPKESAARMVAFNVLLYAVYMLTLVVDGILLAAGVFSGPSPPGMTIVPAAIAGGVIVIFLLFTLIPGDLEKRFSQAAQDNFFGRMARRLATVPSTLAVGTREAMRFVREPSRGSLAVIGAIGFWAAQIGVLWACFKAFGVHVPLAVVVQGFFVGMFANLLPLPGGVGGVDAGMVGAFVLFGYPDNAVFPAVFVFRLITFWLPIVPGVVAFIQLRRTVKRWEERTSPPVGSDLSETLPGAITS